MKPIIPILALLTAAATTHVLAADPPQPPQDPEVQAQDPQPQEAREPQPSSDEIIEEIERLRRREPKPIEPARREPPRGDAAEPNGKDRPDGPANLGVAPAVVRGQGAKYREGEPILARRGRMIRVTDGPSPWILTFDADSSGLQDPPLYLLPCRELEAMEAAALDDEGGTEFIVTGEVFLYHGRAHLLPRIARPAVDRGNLRQ